jgi:O-antigen/teichoic acid export membrane protein
VSVNGSVNRIVIGSGIIFAGTLIGLLLDIIIKRVFTSYLSPGDFGIYSLALTVISITGAIATLGLSDGVARYVAYFRGRNEDHKIHELITSAAVMGLTASVIAMLVSPVLFARMAGNGFDIQDKILDVIKIMIFAIPVTILLNVAVAIYRGFDRTNVNMYFYNLVRPLSLLVFASAAVFFRLSFHEIVFMDLLSMIFTFGLMSVYFIKRPPFELKLKLKFSEPTKQLIRYSLPLLITSTLLNIMSWTATMMLGYFTSAEVVGVYSAVSPLVGFLGMLIGPMGFVYVPVVSKLCGENRAGLVGPIYQIMTKWCFLLTFPIFALMFVYPEFLLTNIYGAQYASGALVLRVLALGSIANSYFGFNYHTIMASGDSDLLMKCSLASAGMNVLLNFILIPQYGILGAAIASSVSFLSIEVFMTFKIWKNQNMHPFSLTYRRLTFIGILMVASMLAARKALLLTGANWEYAAFIILYFVVVLYANILDENELSIIGEIRKEIWYNIGVRIPHLLRIRA